ncbi:hypothetical protein R3P38DRAFT_3524138 [Favolaschia claudopus]|uniref:Uncharacterized protein n=1 Tax=Favolaschia claudopus TaxID=2862362 RepID=A0AAW0E4H4_9AGAR
MAEKREKKSYETWKQHLDVGRAVVRSTVIRRLSSIACDRCASNERRNMGGAALMTHQTVRFEKLGAERKTTKIAAKEETPWLREVLTTRYMGELIKTTKIMISPSKPAHEGPAQESERMRTIGRAIRAVIQKFNFKECGEREVSRKIQPMDVGKDIAISGLRDSLERPLRGKRETSRPRADPQNAGHRNSDVQTAQKNEASRKINVEMAKGGRDA